MKLHFFGGADEVGASAMLIEIEGTHILVDAGIRMGPKQETSLPDFPENLDIDAVLLTHAHTDHTGALPILERLGLLKKNVKTYCTPPTKDLASVLFADSAKRKERESQKDAEDFYDQSDVEAALGRMELVDWEESVSIGDKGVTARWIPAGHILGAGMIYIESKSKRILITGDVSETPQLTVPSVEVPSWCKTPDLMVMEATYGDRQHEKSRKREENGLIREIAETIEGHGKVLIPVFSIGRAQEVLLILKNAKAQKTLQGIPVYVDGMVQKVNDIYSGYIDIHQLPGFPKKLKRETEAYKSLFYSDDISPVTSDSHREAIRKGDPCIIVTSSGMLNGGISNFYAKHLASDPKNLIAITGYQAEGTPGRALQKLAEEGLKGDWKLDGETTVSAECKVETYPLSAHADSGQLIKLVEKVQPRRLHLVHGSQKARDGLEQSLQTKLPKLNVTLPENDQKFRIEDWAGIANGRQLPHIRILAEVAALVREMKLEGPFLASVLAEMWFGTEAITALRVKFFQLCLSWDPLYFFRKSKSSDWFHLKQSV